MSVAIQIVPDDTLVHHGILGQKWGKLNGPPYPLGSSDHSASEKKAGWRKSLDSSDNSQKTKNAKVVDKTSSSSQNENQRKGLSDKQKTAIKIGATVVVAALATYGTYKLAKSGKFDELVNLGKDNIGEIPLDADNISISDVKNLTSENIKSPVTEKVGSRLTPTQAITGRNPTGSNNNCKQVALAVAESHNGHGDLVANEKAFVGNLHDFMDENFKNGSDVVKSITGDSSNIQDRLTKQILKKYSDGDVGIVSIQFDSKYLRNDAAETGHAFNFFVENNSVSFKDGQPDTPLEDASKFFKYVDSNKEVEYCRIDDSLVPNEDALQKSLKRR